MDKYDLDFENIFEYLGIQSFDLEYLKELIREEIKKLYDASIKKTEMLMANLNEQIEFLKSEIIRTTESLNNPDIEPDTKNLIQLKIQELNNKLNILQDNKQKQNQHAELQQKKMLEGIEHVDSFTDQYRALKTIANAKVYAALKPARISQLSQEQLEKYRAIRSILTSTKDLGKYVAQIQLIWNNVNIADRDLSSLEYVEPVISDYKHQFSSFSGPSRNYLAHMQDKQENPVYKYSAIIGHKDGNKWNLEPIKLYEKELEGTDIQIYDFGTFTYWCMPKPDGNYLYSNRLNNLIGVIRRDEEGKLQAYHGVIYINCYDPKFFIDIPFSNIMMRNAQKNNFGHIGIVSESQSLDSEYGHYLDFREVGIGKTTTVLSYAMNHSGECNIGKRNLGEVYEYMDQVMKQKIKDRAKISDKEASNETHDDIMPGDLN